MRQYLDLLEDILSNGVEKSDRTGTGTLSVFGRQLRFSLGEGFPCLTTKRLHLRSIIHELLWFIRGETNVKSLNEVGVRIWDAWADENGDLGPIYGEQWRRWKSPEQDKWGYYDFDCIDQLAGAIGEIRENPGSRRIIVSAWNPSELHEMALQPCHCMFQFYVAGGRLSCQLYQRSADVFLGVPFNIASYSLLTMMVAKITELKPGEFIHTFGDAHLYKNHIDQAYEQLSRTARLLPRMVIHGNQREIDDFKFDDFELVGYDPHPHIAADVSV